jgi:polyisoprenoid-binding protein YceI
VRQLAPGKYEAAGALTIKGTTQNIVVPFTLSDAVGTRTVGGEFALKRLQYKIGEAQWSDTDTVADEVLVRFRFVLPR